MPSKVEELIEMWLSGQKKDVMDTIGKQRSKFAAAFIAVEIYERLDETDKHIFASMLNSRGW